MADEQVQDAAEESAQTDKEEVKAPPAEVDTGRIAKLEAEIAELKKAQDDETVTDDATIQREYDAFLAAQQAAAKVAQEPEKKGASDGDRLARLEQMLLEERAERQRQIAVESIVKQYAKKYEDWEEIGATVMEFAKRGGNAFTDEQYVEFARIEVAKGKPKNREADRTKTEPKKVAPQKAETVRRAASEKPSGAGQSAESK